MNNSPSRGRWVALITGFFSIAIALMYLMMVTILDFRGEMLPPPPEAMGVVGVSLDGSLQLVERLFLSLFP